MPVYTWRSGKPNEDDTFVDDIAFDSTLTEEDMEVRLFPDESWTKDELLAWCEEHDIIVPSHATKAEILDLIKEASE